MLASVPAKQDENFCIVVSLPYNYGSELKSGITVSGKEIKSFCACPTSPASDPDNFSWVL